MPEASAGALADASVNSGSAERQPAPVAAVGTQEQPDAATDGETAIDAPEPPDTEEDDIRRGGAEPEPTTTVDQTNQAERDTVAEGSSPEPVPPTAVAVKPAKRKAPIAMIVTIVAALVAVAVCVTAFVTYRMELWGPRTVPTVEASNADDVVKQLADKGFVVKKKQQYDAVRKGGYIGMEGANPGERIDKGTQVTVLESLGPGVPKGTVGSTAEQAEAKLKPMGVKITEHEVVSENPGKVSVTMPADGQPVTDADEGIHLGVGVQGDGIPVEIAGMDKDQAEQTLSAKGYAVTLEPRFSSRQYLGKIVGADPGIGVKTDATAFTLYYGVDVSGRYDVLTGLKSRPSLNSKDVFRTDRLVGRYCTQNGDCITLSDDKSQKGDATYYVSGEIGRDDSLNLCGIAQSMDVCAPTNQLDSDSARASSLKNSLISGDTGAFELYEGVGSAFCGDTPMPSTPGPMYCNQGVVSSGDVSQRSTGTVYKATDFFVYMPVGADLSALESSDYFTNRSDWQPDKDRPYMIKRDNSEYKPVPIDGNATGPQYNPYVPSSGGKPVKFKEAPDPKNVYYLVETPIDWNLIDGNAGGNTDSSSDSGNTGSASTAEWKDFAGDYTFTAGRGGWATTLALGADGSFTGEFHDDDLGVTGPDYPNGSKAEARFSGRFASITPTGDGSYTLQCDSSGFAVDGTKGDTRIENGMRVTIGDAYGMEPCGMFTLYPKGYDATKISDEVKSWNSGTDPLTGPLTANILVNDSKQESFYQQST